MTTTTNTNEQRRAICPACFAEQAITNGGRLVAHGYTRPQSWHANVGTCNGAGSAHFGTDAGRDVTAGIAARLRDAAAFTTARAVRVLDGSEPVETRQRIAGTRVVRMVAVDNPTAADRARFATGLEAAARQMIAHATELEASVAAWAPREPRTVTVERKVAIVHWRTNRMGRSGKACAGSVRTLHVGDQTETIADVTCTKCVARHAAHAAKAATA